MSEQEMYEDIESVEEIVEEETQEESETEEVFEAKDGVETEKAAVDSVKAAAGAVKGRAKVPGGEANKGDQKMPTTKAGLINAMYSEMNKMKKSDLQASYGKMMNAMKMKEDVDVEEDATAEIHEKAAAVNVDVTADMNALVES